MIMINYFLFNFSNFCSILNLITSIRSLNFINSFNQFFISSLFNNIIFYSTTLLASTGVVSNSLIRNLTTLLFKLLKDTVNPYYCLLKDAGISKKSIEQITSHIIKLPIYCCFERHNLFLCTIL